MPGNYDTVELVALIEERKAPLPYLTRNYFPSVLEFDTEEVAFDYVLGERRMAPFVSPMSAGQVMRSKGSTMKTFRPAYVKPKHSINPAEPLKRMPGEALTGAMSPEARLNIMKAMKYVDQSNMIDNRIEWMVMQILKAGSVTVEGDNYPKQVVDYNRDAGLSITLLTTARWNDSAPQIIDDIESTATAMAQADFGSPASDIIMAPDVWAVMRKDAGVKDLLDTNYIGGNTMLDRAPQVFSNDEDPTEVGRMGRFRLLVDARDYEDDTGSVVPYMGSGEVLMVSRNIGGVQAFGAILDLDVMHAMRAFPKEWKEQDPSVWMVMTQSAPLPIPQRINGCAYLKVF